MVQPWRVRATGFGAGLPPLGLDDCRGMPQGPGMDEILRRVHGRAGRVSLNRPRALNALTTPMCLQITEALVAWREDPAVALVILDHSGERGFCAGGDIRAVAASGAGDGVEAARFFAAEYRLNELLFRYPKPVVAVMDGVTMGGGVGLSAPTRWRIATERTVWAMPEADIGLFPDVGAGWMLARLAAGAGAWLALTGARLKAANCLALGLATHVVASDRCEALKDALATGGEIAAVLAGFAEPPGPAPIRERLPAIAQAFSQDRVEAILARLAADESDWAAVQQDLLARKCPTTLKVGLRLIREGARRASFAGEMEVEYRVALRMARRPDFAEGVRAVLIDKDGAPRWSPARLDEVTDAMLDELFAPLPADQAWTPLP